MKTRERMQIDPATALDLDAIMQIEAQSFTAPWTRRMYEIELNGNPFARTLAARDGANLMGYVCAWVVFEELRLLTLAVRPEHRRGGIASALVRAILAQGREEGTRRAVLEVRASNEAAIALYEQHGFRRHAVRRNYYTDPVEDAVLMELDPIPS
jgi:[ribosomal protein S18]-alanine N-acetyltransferase